MLNFPIDVVITYVSMNDPVWQRSFIEAKSKPENIINLKIDFENNRFEDSGELEICLASIKKNMTYVRKIFLVVSNVEQLPDYIKNYNNLEVVLHKDIIPEQFLPTFNSCAIEMFLHNIPDLCEHFVYFNDDMFILKPSDKWLFFDKSGKTKNCFNYYISNPKKGIYDYSFKNAFIYAKKFVNPSFIYNTNKIITCCHSPKAFLKTTFIKLWNKHADDIINSITAFRSDKNLNQYLFALYDLFTKRCIYKRRSHILLNKKKIDIDKENYHFGTLNNDTSNNKSLFNYQLQYLKDYFKC